MLDNLFSAMFEAPGDPPPPAVEESPPPAEEPAPMETDSSGDNMGAPPDMGDMSDPSMSDDGEDGAFDSGDQNGQQEEDTTPLDEKAEIFAKLKMYKSFRHLYTTIEDTISTIDNIDLVQIGNNINTKTIATIKSRFAELMEDVYSTIVYEFQQSYSNIKLKLVAYSSRYILLSKELTALIKKDQSQSGD